MAAEQSESRAPALAVLAVPNDGFMADQPTNATIVGTDEVLIVDPGDRAGVALVREALAARGPSGSRRSSSPIATPTTRPPRIPPRT